MKFKNMLIGLIVIISSLFITTVKADTPQSFTLISNGQVNGNGEILRGYSSDLPAYFTYKYANISGKNYIVLCTGGRKLTASSGSTYTKDNSWGASIRAGIAAIVINGIGDGATINDHSRNSHDLYFTQVALWKYIQQEIGINQQLTYTLNSCNAAQLEKVNNLYNIGETAKERYNNISNFSVTLNATTLNFTLNGDVYESQVISVSGDEIKNITTTVNKGTVIEKNGGYVVRVAKNLLSVGKTSITLKIDVQSNSIPVASNYTNGNSNQQTTTITLFDYYSKSASKSVIGEITVDPEPVKISKQDATTGKELPGATLKLTGPNNYEKTWISGTTPEPINNLEPGKYTLTEILAPNGYILSTDTITFTVDSEGKVQEPVVMKNYPQGTVEISKQDATTGKELPGAILELTGPNGFSETWRSGTEPYTVKGLEPGKYTLKETQAPNGYKLSEETVTFTVNEKGEVDKKPVMKNYPVGVVLISKQDITTKEELYGAYLEVYKENGTLIESWLSGTEPHTIEDLPEGKYYLKETQAPNGYILSEETIEFEVDENGNLKDIDMVIMYNEVEPTPTPITSSFKSITTSIIGIITIVLGTIIITINYKKNEEK